MEESKKQQRGISRRGFLPVGMVGVGMAALSGKGAKAFGQTSAAGAVKTCDSGHHGSGRWRRTAGIRSLRGGRAGARTLRSRPSFLGAYDLAGSMLNQRRPEGKPRSLVQASGPKRQAMGDQAR
jgi:hypothetical protein